MSDMPISQDALNRAESTIRLVMDEIVSRIETRIVGEKEVADLRHELYTERKAAFRELMDERQARALERDQAIIATATADRLAAREANIKAEATDKENRQSANEWRGAMKDILATLASKELVDTRFAGLENKINDLERTRSKTGGKDEAIEQARALHRWVVGIGVSILFSLIAVLVRVFST